MMVFSSIPPVFEHGVGVDVDGMGAMAGALGEMLGFQGRAAKVDVEQLVAGLNPAQREAVLFGDGPLLVLAGAGSGKTRVLTHRIAYLLEQPDRPGNACFPEEILSVTFTNKAAREMQERVGHLVGEGTARRLWMGTFHSVCARILRNYIHHYAPPSGRTWTSRFVIYDTDDSLSVIKDALKKLNLDDKLYPPRVVKDQIGTLKNSGIDAWTYASQAKGFQAERLASLYDQYERLLCENNALDFDDLLMLAVRLLMNHADTRQRLHRQFRHILIDEFQDTNAVQYQLVRLLALGDAALTAGGGSGVQSGRSLTVVGDVDQSIYSWRGANFRIILGFQKDFQSAALIKLEENYRSTATILEAANAIIENNQERLPKVLRSNLGQGQPITCHELSDDGIEALHVVDRLQQLTQQGHRPGDCCVLYRTNSQSRVLEDALMARGIPYQLIGGVKFYERKEIRDLLSYLTVLFNPDDSYSLKRALAFPKRGIGKTSLEKLEQEASRRGISLWGMLQTVKAEDGIVKGKQLQAIAEFVRALQTVTEKWRSGAVTQVDVLIRMLRDVVDYDRALREDDPTDAEDRLENLEELQQVAFQFTQAFQNSPEAEGGDALGEFLAKMSLLSDLDAQEEQADSRVVLMTIHASKGLEFPVVLLCGMEEGIFPHFRSLDRDDMMEEERRLMYVAVTRAKHKLFMSFARQRFRYGETKYSVPSRFLKEIPTHLMTGLYALERGESRETPRSRYTPRDEDTPSWSRSSGQGFTRETLREQTRQLGKPKTGAQDDDSRMRELRAATQGPGLTAETFERGDRVSHEKFGEGTVDQVMGSGEKRIYSIQFDRIPGKKLIDPRYAKLVKVN